MSKIIRNHQDVTLERFKQGFRDPSRYEERPVKQFKTIYCLRNRQGMIVFRSESELERDTEYLRLMALGREVQMIKYRKKQ